MTEVVLTGASGFIGKMLLPKLLSENLRVMSLHHMHAASSSHERLREVPCDLLDRDQVRSALPKTSCILHLAGHVQVSESLKNPARHLRENTLMLLNVLDVLRERGEKPLVVCGSTDRQYARHTGIVDESASIFPVEPYTGSKIIGETLLQTYAHAYGIPYIALRIDSVYGPGQPPNMFISDVLKRAMSGETVEVGLLDVEKCFVYVNDVADAFIAAMRSPRASWNAAYNIGGDKASLQQVLDLLLDELRTRYNRSVTVTRKAPGRDPAFEVRSFTLSIERAAEALGWVPRTPLREGLARTVASFLSSQ